MALLQKDVDTAAFQQTAVPDKSDEELTSTLDADAQDEALWESKFADSQDTLAHLAARSRAHRKAGRTQKIGP